MTLFERHGMWNLIAYTLVSDLSALYLKNQTKFDMGLHEAHDGNGNGQGLEACFEGSGS